MKKVCKFLAVIGASGFVAGAAFAQSPNYPVTMNVADTEIRSVLNLIANIRPGVSLVIDDDVKGNVTVNLKDVEWEKAMKLVLMQKGYRITQVEDNIFRISVKGEDVVPFPGDVTPEVFGEANSGSNYDFVQPDLVVRAMTPYEMAQLDLESIKELIGYNTEADGEITLEQAVAKLKSSGVTQIKELLVTEKPASEVIAAIGKVTKTNYSISRITEKNSYDSPIVSDVADADAVKENGFEEGFINISLNNVSSTEALEIVAGHGGYKVEKKGSVLEFSPATQGQDEPLTIEAFRVDFVKVNEELLESLRGALTKRGSVKFLGKKSILVKDTKEAIANTHKVLKAVDVATPQVQVEVRFFEVSNDDDLNIGFDWKQMLLTEGIKGHTNGWHIADNKLKTNDLLTDFYHNYTELDANGTLKPATSMVTSLDDSTIFTIDALHPVLRALEESTYATQLSNPKIIIASDEQATIHIGRQIPIVQSEFDNEGETPTITVSLDGAFGGKSGTQVNLTDKKEATTIERTSYAGYLDVGTMLTVCPSVKNETDVYVKIIPELVSVQGEISPIAGISYPILSKTAVYSEFMLKSGQTAAIGGLVNETLEDTEEKVPFLGEIPFLGKLFTYKSKEERRSEVLIFVTVKIVGVGLIGTTTGIPIESKLSQQMVEKVKAGDAKGAEYNETVVKALDAVKIADGIEADNESKLDSILSID